MSAPELAWELPDAFVVERVVAEDEIDRLGHANNAAYLRWCEDAGWEHTESVGCTFADWEKLGRAMATTRSMLEYKAPCFAGDRIAVGVWLVANNGRLRATRRFQILRCGDGVQLFRAEIEYASIDLETGRPRRMPPEFIEAYAVLPSVAEALAREPDR